MLDDGTEWRPAKSWLRFGLLTVAQLWAAHALVFFCHEYAHATTAWLMGWKLNPLGLSYGHLTVANALVQSSIDENVNYAPIFAAGRGWQAGVIAAAGVVIGNGLISYPLSRWALGAARRRDSRGWAMLAYWSVVASVGNFLDYVPVRVFSPREDMHTTATGFGCSPWVVLVVLGVPFGMAVVEFLWRLEPREIGWLLPRPARGRGVMAVLTAFALFGFYGAAGWRESGPVSHAMSVISVCGLAPVMAVVGWWRSVGGRSG